MRETHNCKYGELAIGEVIRSKVLSEGTKVMYKKDDRIFLNLEFPQDYVLVKDEDVVGSVSEDDEKLEGG